MIRTITAKYRSTCRATGAPIKPGDLIEYDTDSRATYLAHATRTRPGYVSHVFSIGNREFYRNKAGRCEDAPCCGCCTI